MLRHSLLVAVALHVGAGSLLAQRIYWGDSPAVDTADDAIRRAALDGTAAELLVTLPRGRRPTGIALDLTTNTMYWLEAGTELAPFFGAVRRANLDGSGEQALVDVLSGPGGGDIAVDPGGGKVYWSEFDGVGTRRANLDGSAAEVIAESAFGLDLDLDAGKLYWANAGIPSAVRRANLDGSAAETLFTAPGVDDVVVDAAAGQVYTAQSDGIWRRNLDGTAAQLLIAAAPTALALDLAGNRIYWTERTTELIRRANLDGSGVEDLFMVVRPTPIALDLRECSGNGAVVDGVCVCDPGWSGAVCDCSTGACPADCSGNGACVCGKCDCDPGWGEDDCSCSTVCPGDCSGNGTCDCGTCVCDPGWSGADCGCSTAPCPADCSGNGTCVCGACVCDAGWEGPDCSCMPEPCPNNCSGNGLCECGVCLCDPAFSGPDCSTPSDPRRRLFMAPDGQQFDAAVEGPTAVFMTAGSTRRIMTWLSDTTGSDDVLDSYQLLFPRTATPLAGATGSVEYVDKFPGAGGGDSIFLDVDRADWVFASEPVVLPVFYNETDNMFLQIFGVLYISVFTFDVIPAQLGGIPYLCEFELAASADATGTFEFLFSLVDPPITSLFDDEGMVLLFDEYQPLHVVVTVCGDGVAEGGEGCDDGNDQDGDGCTADCLAEVCGDGTINNGNSEQCDDGNNDGGDGCSAICTLEFCGDGLINNVVEACDDGNAGGGDGCSAACAIEDGFQCSGEPSVCGPELQPAPAIPAVTGWGMAVLVGLLGSAVWGRTRRDAAAG